MKMENEMQICILQAWEGTFVYFLMAFVCFSQPALPNKYIFTTRAVNYI